MFGIVSTGMSATTVNLLFVCRIQYGSYCVEDWVEIGLRLVRGLKPQFQVDVNCWRSVFLNPRGGGRGRYLYLSEHAVDNVFVRLVIEVHDLVILYVICSLTAEYIYDTPHETR